MPTARLDSHLNGDVGAGHCRGHRSVRRGERHLTRPVGVRRLADLPVGWSPRRHRTARPARGSIVRRDEVLHRDDKGTLLHINDDDTLSVMWSSSSPARIENARVHTVRAVSATDAPLCFVRHSPFIPTT